MEGFSFFSAYAILCLQLVLYVLGIFVAIRILRYLHDKKEHDQQVLQELRKIRERLQDGQ
ncbi:hypothetical protein [Ectobacillus ponti]|uniref:Uncharacterized protein n=1 Tax=Ectobacillus ponti TaxID=2961894 RepID=A0AA41X9H1_9BACI|nr:hypothetical protein [Ectobacillus ponti]MCP8969350.1 hypothetical protein [Ectobacillus ponti]